VPTPGEAQRDKRPRRTGGGWHDLPLRAQGLVVLAVPVLGLVAAACLVAVDVGSDPSTISLATLAVLGLAIAAAAGATIAFMRDLTNRVNHLQANADRLARDARLSPGARGSDELAVAEATLARAGEVLASRQRQLEEAQASLEHLVSAGPMVMFAGALTTDLGVESPLLLDYISSNSARVMGHSPIALLDDPGAFIAMVHKDDVGPLLSAARRAVGDSRGQITIEFRVRHVDGSWRWMEGMVRGHEVEPTRVLGYAVDITARRAAELAQRQSESRLSAFLDNSSALISLKDPFGRYQFANQALTELFGVPGARVVGSDDFDHWPAAAPMLRARDQQILVTREPMQFEEVIELADGPHTFLSVKFPLLDDDGVPVAVGSISTDITEVKDAVAATAARERVLSTVIGASPDVITILEDDGTIRTTSVAFERIFGYPTRALVDQKLVDVVHPEDRAETAARLAGLQEGDGRDTLRFRGRTADGMWVTIESHAQVITRPDGSNDGIVMVSRDITDQIALEQALRRAKDQAERASNAKSEFLSRVSHELRTPLNAMLGFAQLLELEELEEPCTEYVDQIAKAGDHLLALINEVLDIARIESDNVNLRLEAVSALEAVHEVLDLTAPLAARAGVSLHGPDVDDVDVLLTADRQRLLQVLLNLVSNAIKYNHDGGRVDLTVAEEADRVVLTVHDTGPGLADEQIERLFVPFDRLGLEHSGIEGTGVGLALSRGLTERMGGTLSVRSTPGAGSAFSIELPGAAAVGPAAASPSASTTATPADGAPGAEPASLPTLTGGRQ
jgi:PAS domain S-box-containing protein